MADDFLENPERAVISPPITDGAFNPIFPGVFTLVSVGEPLFPGKFIYTVFFPVFLFFPIADSTPC